MSRFRSDDAPAVIRAARADAGLTQLELARRAGLRQPSLAQMESGTRPVSEQMLERVLRAAGVHEVEELTGFPTDVVSDTNVPAALADAVREAVPL